MTLALTIPVEPRPMPRPHAAKRGGVYFPAWVDAYREEVQAHLMLGTRGRPVILGPVSVTLRFVLSERRDRRKDGDLDNLCKLVLDSCNGVLWKDDRQVVELHAYCTEAERGRVELSVEEL